MSYDFISQDLADAEDMDLTPSNDEKVATGTESFVTLHQPKKGSLDAKLTYMGNKPEDKNNPGTRLHIRTIIKYSEFISVQTLSLIVLTSRIDSVYLWTVYRKIKL